MPHEYILNKKLRTDYLYNDYLKALDNFDKQIYKLDKVLPPPTLMNKA